MTGCPRRHRDVVQTLATDGPYDALDLPRTCASSAEKPSAQRPRTELGNSPWTRRAPSGFATAISRSRRRTLAPICGRPSRGRESACALPRSRGDARRRPSRVGRPPGPISSGALPIAARSKTADQTNEWQASVGCAGRQPTAAAAPVSRELECGVVLPRTISRTTWMTLATIGSA